MLSTLLVAVSLAIPLGVLAAWKARHLVDRLVMTFAVLGFAMPVFLVGYVLIYLFAVKLGWLPVQGYVPIREGLWPWAESLILPSRRARHHLHGADRPHHARLDAGSAGAGLHPHRRPRRAWRPTACCCCTR